jgi:hypothetical protein
MSGLSKYLIINTLKFVLISKQYDLLSDNRITSKLEQAGDVYKRYLDILADLVTN